MDSSILCEKQESKITRLLTSYWLELLEFIFSAVVVVCDIEVAGAMVLVWIIIFKLIFCRDILATFSSYCCMCVFLADCYNSADLFLSYLWMAVPFVSALLAHFIIYRPKKLRIGINFWGSLAVTAAVMLGGVGVIPLKHYLRLTSLYYVIFLGAGMLIFYVIMNNYVVLQSRYDIFKRFSITLYAMGLLACFALASFHIKDVYFQCSNSLSTTIMIALPIPCYFAVKYSRWHLLGFVTMIGGLVISTSRGGLVMGAVEALICIVYLCWADKKHAYLYVLTSLAIAVVGLWNFTDLQWLSDADGTLSFISMDEARVKLLVRSIEDFKSSPIFGKGIDHLGNEDIYDPVKGAMHWYHMMIPQIIGSMGICGIVAYTSQFVLRAYTVFKRMDAYKLAMGICYLGLFLMSQVNPGEFCPVPYGMFGILIFMMLEKYDKSRRLP